MRASEQNHIYNSENIFELCNKVISDEDYPDIIQSINFLSIYNQNITEKKNKIKKIKKNFFIFFFNFISSTLINLLKLHVKILINLLLPIKKKTIDKKNVFLTHNFYGKEFELKDDIYFKNFSLIPAINEDYEFLNIFYHKKFKSAVPFNNLSTNEYFSIYSNIIKGYFFLLFKALESSGIKRKILLQASCEILSGDSFFNICLANCISKIVKNSKNIQNFFFLFEGYSYERLLIRELKFVRKEIELIAYSHNFLDSKNNALLFLKNKTYYPDKILCINSTDKEIFKKKYGKIEVVNIGKYQLIKTFEDWKIIKQKNLKFLLTIGGYEKELYKKLDFLKVFKKMNLDLIIRLHPVLNNDNKKRIEITNFFKKNKFVFHISENKYLGDDLARSNILLSSNGTVIFEAINNGIFPIISDKTSQNKFNPFKDNLMVIEDINCFIDFLNNYNSYLKNYNFSKIYNMSLRFYEKLNLDDLKKII